MNNPEISDLLTEAYELLHEFEYYLRQPCKFKIDKKAETLIKLLDLDSRIEDALYNDYD